MQTIKELRTKLGLNQSDFAGKINISVPAYSLLENGQSAPTVEDAVYFEKEFSQRIDWSPNEKITLESKQEILSAINTLAQHYPLVSVLNFVMKYVRDGHLSGSPEKIITWYCKISKLNDVDVKPLLTPDIKRTR